MTKPKILLIEDERSIRDILRFNLEREGLQVAEANDGFEGMRKAQSFLPDLVILDLMLPAIDGLEVCRQLRADSRLAHTRILMLTARSEEVDEIVGFNMGADDYVSKPFKIKPLIHRIKAMLRRTPENDQSRDLLTLGNLKVDRMHHTAVLGNEELKLTPTEFKLLWTLAKSPGRPYARNELMDYSRGEDANALERTIDVHIRSLRQKLGPLADCIETVRGVGYRFRMLDGAEAPASE